MRVIGTIAAAWLTLSMTASTVQADTAAERVAAGEQLAKEGRLTEAIESFKAADKLEQRAKHACLIALAYIRRELWPQAEIFMTRCHQRATASDPVPDWAALAEKQMNERLASAKVSAVHVRIEPTALAATAKISVSSFPADETFAPRTIHLPSGSYSITATLGGDDAKTQSQTIEVRDQTPREVVFTFGPPSAPTTSEPGATPNSTPMPAQPETPPGASRSKIPLAVMGAGAAILVGGVAFHLLAFKPARDDLAAASDANNATQYDQLEGTFDSRRTTTIALYGIGAATLITGVILDRTVFRHHESAPHAALSVSGDGAFVSVEWMR